MSYTITYLGKPFAQRTALSVLQITASSAESAYVDCTNLIRIGAINLGTQLQSNVAIVPAFTLMDPEFASKTANDSKVIWDTQTSQAANLLKGYFIVATVVRIAFSAAGTAYLTVF